MKGHFEARKHGFRQTQDGVVVSFVMHPNDVNGDFAAAPLGTIFVIGYATPEEAEGGDAQSRPSKSGDSDAAPVAEHSASSGGAPKRRWSDLSASQQAGIRCAEQGFQEWLWGAHAEDDEAYPESPSAWETWTTKCVRECCHVITRRELDTDDLARARWQALDTAYEQAVGRVAVDPRSGA